MTVTFDEVMAASRKLVKIRQTASRSMKVFIKKVSKTNDPIRVLELVAQRKQERK